MKIGIITIVDLTNYGNRLQNYALSHYLRTRFGCKTTTLTSCPEKAFYDGDFVLWVKNQVAQALCVFPRLAEKRFGNGITRWQNFSTWTRRHIPTKTYYACDALPDTISREYDLFFAGSDQIWNYRFPSTRFQDYFLKFAESGKKVAYSASFGVAEIPPQWQQCYRDGLSDFSRISVREDAGQRIVSQLLGVDAPVLIDPTMLLTREEWLRVAKKPRVDCSRPYVLKYYLGEESGEDKIDRWAEENGYAVYPLLDDQIPALYSAGPGEFLSLIANAALVASDSFHAIVFSIIFQRPFLVYSRRGSEEVTTMTSRLDTLLGKFGLEDRWFHRLDPSRYLSCDYSQTDEILAREREKAHAFIRSALSQS